MLATDFAILVIAENGSRASLIEAGLREAGYHRVTLVQEIRSTAEAVTATLPDAIVIDLENPSPGQLEHFFALAQAIQRPIAMFVNRSDSTSIEAAVAAGIAAYVVDGLKKERLKPILEMAISRFNAHSRLNRELEEARGELESRKIIDKARGILMQTRGLEEAEAYALLRRTAMNQNRKISDIAQSLVTAAELLER